MVISQRSQRQSFWHERVLLWNNALLAAVDDEFFSPDYWRSTGALLDQAAGRGCTYAFEYKEERYFLRHFRRGGLIAGLFKDFYLWTGLESTRAWREMDLLQAMAAANLPVPLPAAARIIRTGPVYRADIITRSIPDAAPLSDRLQHQEISPAMWQRVGACIRRFHDHGISHADLNAHNILIDDHDMVWLIDFDKGMWCKPNSLRKQANLKRLRRSLNKIWPSDTQADLDMDAAWHNLMQGYSISRSA